jgi:carbon-monoxide dehydrogenase medium subunit
MNFRLARPAALVDLNRIGALAFVTELPNGGLRIGAMTRQRTLERNATLTTRAPLLAEALPWIAHPQIRNRGTVGGSLAHADPAAELPAVMVALDAQFTVRSATGSRKISAETFYTGLFSTALATGEILAAIDVPPPAARSGSAFVEVARRHGDFALVGVAAHLTLDSSGRCSAARIALLSVGDGPVLARNAAQALVGRAVDDRSIDDASRSAADRDVDPPSDIHASAAYRRHLSSVLVARALKVAAARATKEPL